MAKPTPRSRTKQIALVGLVLLLLAVCVVIRFHDELAVSAVQVYPDRVPRLARNACTIVPGVHLLGGLSPSAAYVLETTAGLVLIDSGLDADAERLKSEMATLKLDWRKIVAILLTHCHGDHCGGRRSAKGGNRGESPRGGGRCRGTGSRGTTRGLLQHVLHAQPLSALDDRGRIASWQ